MEEENKKEKKEDVKTELLVIGKSMRGIKLNKNDKLEKSK